MNIDDLKAEIADIEKGDTTQDVDPLPVIRAKTMKVSKDQLQAAVDSNPEHPVAQVYAKSLLTARDHLYVEVIDLKALLENKEVIISRKKVTDPKTGKLTTEITKSLSEDAPEPIIDDEEV